MMRPRRRAALTCFIACSIIVATSPCHAFFRFRNQRKTATKIASRVDEPFASRIATANEAVEGPPKTESLFQDDLFEDKETFWNRDLRRELLAEFVATALLVQLCTGAGFASTFLPGDVDVDGVLITVIAVTTAASTTACISGAHLNPAVSLAFALARPTEKFGLKKVLPYGVAQVLGAMAGSGINVILFSEFMRVFKTANKSGLCIECAKVFGCNFFHPVTPATAFLAELFGTFIIGFTIMSLTHERNRDSMAAGHVPLLVALAVGGVVTVIGPLTQAGFNPARDFGPRLAAMLFAGYDSSVAFLPGWWVYLVAPMIGAPLGAMFAEKILFGS